MIDQNKDVQNSIVLTGAWNSSSNNGIWHRVGYCSHCGECCKRIRADMKTSCSPDSYCMYIYSENDKKLCEIRTAYDENDSDFLEMIPQEHYDFWFNECKDYPDPNKSAHRPPRHMPEKSCTLRIKRVDG